MMPGMSGQAWLFFSTVLVGAGIGFFYDAFRVFRKTAPQVFNKNATVQIEDMLFWAAATAGMFYFMLNQNFGEIRLFSVIGAGVGIALYFAALSRAVIFISVHIINFLKKIFATLFKIIFAPFRAAHSRFAPKIRSGLLRLSRYGKIRIRKTARSLFILRKKV